MTAQLSRERLERVVKLDDVYDPELTKAMASMLLAGLDSEPVYQVLSGDAWVDVSYGAMCSQKRVGANVRTVYSAPPATVALKMSKDEIRQIFMNNGFTIKEGQNDLKCYVYDAAFELISSLKLPPPVAVPDELTREEYKRRFMEEDNFDDTYRSGWEACRAAMLNAGPEKQKVTLREGIQALRDLGGIDAEKILAERDSLNGADACWCHTCRPVTITDMRFVVCPDCGNKRCPRANDHRNACSDSNEPGQVGSAYPAAPEQEV